MSENSITNAVAKRDTSPTAMITTNRDDLAEVLPTHVNVRAWCRQAAAAVGRNPDLIEAAQANPGAFWGALMDAAQLGLTPGTPEFYLVPRKMKGNVEIQGMTGYQGLVELMFRAGAVTSIVAEVVFEGEHFDYAPGRDRRPDHRPNWDSPVRGDMSRALRVYAYAEMIGDATSKVIVLSRSEVMALKARSRGSDSQYSPWQTAEQAMWLKSAVRQLARWVPTSSEYVREKMRTAAQAQQLAAQTPAEDQRPVIGEVVDE